MDKPTIDTYDQLATDYDDETVAFWDDFPREVIDKFTVLAAGQKVLDVGCGPGRDGLILQASGLDVTGLDASKTMVDLCNKRGLKSVVGDFNKLPFNDASFGAAWAYTSLLHVKRSEVDRPMQEITRVLNADGILGIGMIEGDWEGYRESAGVNKPRWFSFYTKQELEDLLARHGFEVVFFSTFKPSSKNYLNFIARKLPK